MLFDGHNAYITASYLAVFLAIGAMVVRIAMRRATTTRALAELETRQEDQTAPSDA